LTDHIQYEKTKMLWGGGALIFSEQGSNNLNKKANLKLLCK